MISNPKVTVAIPVYNVERFVERSINSVIDQDYNNIEILIVYDLSIDDSLTVVMDVLQRSSFQYRIIKKNEANKGIGKSRNIILDNFQGDYLYFLDSDDFIKSHTISLLVKEAIESNADIVVASHQSIDEKGNNTLEVFKYQEKTIFSNKDFKKYVYLDNGYFSVYSWNKLYKKSFLKESNLRYIHNVVEDAVFSFLEIRKIDKIVLLPDVTLNYVINDSSITNAIMYNDLSLEIAEIYLSIRDYKFSINNSDIVEDVCSNVDVFKFCYTMIVRDTYKSKNISEQEKLKLCRNAFITPTIPLKFFLKLLNSKKKSLLLLLIVKIIPFRLNMLLVKFYHKP